MKLTATLLAFCALGAAGNALAGAEDAPMNALALNVKTSQDSPWFQRFTFGSDYSNDANGWSSGSVKDDSQSMRVTTAGKNWGMTLGVREKKDWAPLGQAATRENTSVGAFYNITPRVRFGGEMTLESRGGAAPLSGGSGVEPGVKFGSAFRF